MDEIVFNRIIVLLFLAVSVGITYLIIRKSNRKAQDKNKAKAGCFTAFFIWVPISLLVTLTPFMLLLGVSTAKQLYQLASDSDFKPYTAQVVRYEDIHTERFSDRNGSSHTTRYVEMGTPVVTFTIESGQELERALPFATEVNGESSYNIRYKASTDEIIVTYVYYIVAKIIGLIIFFVIAVFAYWGIYGYLTDRPTDEELRQIPCLWGALWDHSHYDYGAMCGAYLCSVYQRIIPMVESRLYIFCGITSSGHYTDFPLYVSF